jgi:hypothetical protein
MKKRCAAFFFTAAVLLAAQIHVGNAPEKTFE